MGNFTFSLRLSLSLFAEPKLKLNAKVCTGGKLVNLTGNKSNSYARTCLLNCAAHANDIII